jgi:hypothetical protein
MGCIATRGVLFYSAYALWIKKPFSLRVPQDI